MCVGGRGGRITVYGAGGRESGDRWCACETGIAVAQPAERAASGLDESVDVSESVRKRGGGASLCTLCICCYVGCAAKSGAWPRSSSEVRNHELFSQKIRSDRPGNRERTE